MLYLLLAFVLIATGAGLYLYSRFKNQELPKSSKVMFALFFLLGLAMSAFALQETGPDQEKHIEGFLKEYPELAAVVEARKPTILMYEYLEILEAYKAAKRADAL